MYVLVARKQAMVASKLWSKQASYQACCKQAGKLISKEVRKQLVSKRGKKASEQVWV